MKNLRCIAGLALSLLTLTVAPRSRGQVIYDNLGTSDPYPKVGAFLIGGAPQQEIALRFTAASSLFLDYADLQLWNQFGAGTAMVNVAILANTATNAPGAVLEQTSVLLPASTTLLPVARAEFSNTLFLTAGSLFWLAVSPADSSTNSGWEHTATFGPGATISMKLVLPILGLPWVLCHKLACASLE